MLQRVLAVGLLAGLVAGLAIAALQHVTTTPLILKAEVYEKAEHARAHEALASADGAPVILAHAHDGGVAHGGASAAEEGWQPADGLERTLFTSLATVVTAIGFALILIAGMTASGERIDERRALAWAGAAFVATGLAPALGLAPELPGSASAPLVARQLWWGATAAATALSLWLFLRAKNPWAKLGAVLLIAAPHVVGAPQPAELVSRAPAELAAAFTASSLVLQALLWMAVGWAVGFFWPRLGPRVA